MPSPVAAQRYYWTSEQTEWATDVCFRDAAALADLYAQLTRHSMTTFQSVDVMRFLGHKLPAHGGVHGKYAGEIVSDLKHRPEGICVRHRLKLKMYDKFGSVLRRDHTQRPQGSEGLPPQARRRSNKHVNRGHGPLSLAVEVS
jgi:hypothetical protein